MIAFPCPACKKNLTVKDEFAGKRGNCPHCKQPLTVPAPAPTLPKRKSGLPAVAGQTLPDAPPPMPAEAVTAPPGDDHSGPDPAAAPKLDFLAPPKQPDELGRLGKYRLLKLLGAGGMGMVFHAEDPILKRFVALKVMRPEVAAKADNRKRFLREAQATAALEHDHIIAIYEVNQERGVPFIAMPFLKGEALDVRLKREGKLPVGAAVRIGREIAEGLAHAHERGLIHRDIKPGNVWLEAPRDRVKILDFGLARIADDDAHITKSGAILGTPAYMAPEQALGKPVDARVDLFSLGAVLYHMLTGDRPFRGPDTMAVLSCVLTETPRTPRDANPAVPAALSELVMQLLAKEPKDRPASAQAVAEALAALEDRTQQLSVGVPPSGGPPAPPQGGTPTGRILRLPFRLAWRLLTLPGRLGWIIRGTLALLLLVAMLWLLLPGGSGPDAGTTVQGRAGTTAKTTEPEQLFTKMVLIPKGKFLMRGGGGNAGTKEVEIKHDFYLGQYEVTQWEWMQVMERNPSGFASDPAAKPLSNEERAKLTLDELKKALEKEKRAKENYWKAHPVESVSWEDCQEFLRRLNEKEKASRAASAAGWVYRLPTEAEWEYACRGGSGRPVLEYAFDYYFEQPTNILQPDMANYKDSGKNRTCPVGSYKPNRLGLFDMHGNVWEWCDDRLKDEKGADRRVIRGGSWLGDAGDCRAAARYLLDPGYWRNNLGLRLARLPVGSSK